MYLLNLEGAVTAFKNVKEVDTDFVNLPDDIDREKFMLFLRIMKAEAPADISDISTEEIISLYEHLAVFSRYFGERFDYLRAYRNDLRNKRAVRLKRRIL